MKLLKDIVSIEKGKGYDLLDEFLEGAIRVFRANDFRNESKPQYTLESEGLLANEDDILVVWDGSVGQMGFGKVGYVGSTIVRVRVKNKKEFSPFFIYKFLQTKSEFLKRKSTGATIMHINRKSLEQLEIPKLPFSDQIQIANILSKAETLIEQRKQSIALLDEFLKSTFLEMFGTPTSNKKKFPKGTIRDIVTEVKYGTSKPAEEKGKYPYLRMNNITSDGYWDFSKMKFINMDDDNEKKKCSVKKDDLLFNRTNSKELVGKTAVFNLDDEMIIAGYLIRLRFNEKANPYFVWGYLNSLHGKQTLLGMCNSIVGMANINAQELQDIRIIIPPIELQNEFATIVSKTETLKEEYKNSLGELENLYGSLSQRAFKGEMEFFAVVGFLHQPLQ